MIKSWLLALIPITLLSGLIFAAGQQNYRQSANDPQIQLAEDAAASLSKGQPLQTVIPTTVIDLHDSLAPFVIVFDDQGSPIASSAQIDGKTPIPPAGVFEQVRQNGQDRLTWQPDNSTRIASVVTRYTGTSSGFIVAGRSLREVENRTQALQQMVLIGWGVTAVATLAGALILGRFQKS